MAAFEGPERVLKGMEPSSRASGGLKDSREIPGRFKEEDLKRKLKLQAAKGHESSVRHECDRIFLI